MDPNQTIELIAAREGKSERSIRMTLSLAFIAPPIVVAAIEGRLPRGLPARPTLAVTVPTSSHLKRRLCGIGANKKREPARRQRQQVCAVPPAEKLSHAKARVH
jgi:hypothetical protein